MPERHRLLLITIENLGCIGDEGLSVWARTRRPGWRRADAHNTGGEVCLWGPPNFLGPVWSCGQDEHREGTAFTKNQVDDGP